MTITTEYRATARTGGGDTVGRIAQVSGTAMVVRTDGAAEAARTGAVLAAGDVLITKGVGTVGAVLADGTVVSLGQEGRLAIDAASYDGARHSGRVALALAEGNLIIVTGDAARGDPDAFALSTPLAVVRITGTQVGVDLPAGGPLTVALMVERDGFAGEVTVTNDGGTAVLNETGRAVRVEAFDEPPAEMAGWGEADTVAQFHDTLAVLPLDVGLGNSYGLQALPQGFETAANGGPFAADGPLHVVAAGPVGRAAAAGVPDLFGIGRHEPETPSVAETAAAERRDDTAFEGAVSKVNTAPEAADESVTTAEDAATAGLLTATDADGDDVVFAMAAGGGPVHGSVTVAADGAYTYTPDADFHGTDSFRYVVTDIHGAETTASVTVTVTPVNDAPVLTGGAAVETLEDNAISGRLEADDVDGDNLTFALAEGGAPAHGTVAIESDGSFLYTPAPDFSGDDSFTCQVSDGHGGVDTGVFHVAVAPVADAPALELTPVVVDTGGLAGTQNLVGTGAADVLIGGGGADLLDGRGGADILYGDGTESAGPVSVGLDIHAAPADTDGSETLTVRVSGLPEGVTLSAGEPGDDGWLLTPDQLDGLTLTLPQDFRDSFDLHVTAVATDTDVGSGLSDTASVDATLNVSFAGGAGGADQIAGGAGNDLLYGGVGDDVFHGNIGADTVYGGPGHDTLYGDDGTDRLFGGVGDDVLHGNIGADTLDGGSGNDTLYGDEGTDRLFGGTGDDIVIGGAASDIMTGGEGSDTFLFAQGDGSDRITDFAVGDALRFEGARFTADRMTIANNAAGDAVISFSGVTNDVTLEGVSADQISYSVQPSPQAIVITIDEGAPNP